MGSAKRPWFVQAQLALNNIAPAFAPAFDFNSWYIVMLDLQEVIDESPRHVAALLLACNALAPLLEASVCKLGKFCCRRSHQRTIAYPWLSIAFLAFAAIGLSVEKLIGATKHSADILRGIAA